MKRSKSPPQPPLADRLSVIHVRAAAALAGLTDLFTPDMKLTFIARHPDKPEAFVVLTEDDLRAIAATLVRQADKEASAK